MEPSEHPLYGVVIEPLTVPLFPHEPLNVAAAGLNPATSSQVIETLGQAIVAGPAPITVTSQDWLILLPQLSAPE